MRRGPSWFRAAFLCCSLLVVACSGDGGKGGGRIKPDGDDAGDGNDGGGHFDWDTDAGQDASTAGCKKVCDPDDCGEAVADRCGGFLSCSSCTDGKICGVLREDKCDFPQPAQCTPKTAAEVCVGKCGAVADGCSDVILCDGSNGGLTCGASQFCKNEACVDPAGIPPKQPSEVCSGKCGFVSDGVSGVVECTGANGGLTCAADEICQGNACVDRPPEPACLTAADCTGKCGFINDKCGGFIDCDPNHNVCGAGYECKSNACTQIPNVPNPPACQPTQTIQQACANKCGFVNHECGVYDCSSLGGAGNTCSGGKVCTNSTCVTPTVPVCTPDTSSHNKCPAVAGKTACGSVPQYECNANYDCGTCGNGETCGAGGANLCGTTPTCQAPTIATVCNGKCGVLPTGCGNATYDCDAYHGACSGGQTCGGGGKSNVCGTPATTCVPHDCQGSTCGNSTDGCGHQISCWPQGQTQCAAGSTCAVKNGIQQCVTGVETCTGNLCNSACPKDSTVTLSGTVITPGRNGHNKLPVPNAFVYIPADTDTSKLPTIFEGVAAGNAASCGRCADEKLVVDGQSVLAWAKTDYDGKFTLTGRLPKSAIFRIVIKIGKWRGVQEVAANKVTSCTGTFTADAASTTLPATRGGLAGNNLPKIAISTGNVDEMECVLLNMGFDSSEFAVPTDANARIHMYRANGAQMAAAPITCSGTYTANNNTVNCNATVNGTANAGCVNRRTGCTTTSSNQDSNLTSSPTTLNKYDMVVFDCEGYEEQEDTDEPNLETYVNNGGRMFASHFSYIWIEDNGTLKDSAAWHQDGSTGSGTGLLSQPSGNTTRTRAAGADAVAPAVKGFKAIQFAKWMTYQGALTGTAAGNTTIPATPQFSITDPRDRAGATSGAATDEWLYRDVAYCSNGASQLCTQKSDCRVCTTKNNGNLVFCGSDNDCPNNGSCQSTNNAATGNCMTAVCSNKTDRFCSTANDCRVCQNSASTFCTTNTDCPNTANRICQAAAATCDSNMKPRVQQLSFNTPYAAASDSICGRVAYSGFHVSSASNFNGTFPDVCEADHDLTSQEKTLAFQLFDLGTCVSVKGDPITPPGCIKLTQASCPATACGLMPDGCGGTVDCGGCAAGSWCNGSTCQVQQCVPSKCSDFGYNCGSYSDGCGGLMDGTAVDTCGACTGNQVCGLNTPGVCAPRCPTYKTQAQACGAATCGVVSDGCDGTYTCGTCGAGSSCSAGQCVPGTCSKQTQANACGTKQCGKVSDGCNGSYSCGDNGDGTCDNPDTCGGGGVAGQCGHPQCVPLTMAQACDPLKPAGNPNATVCGWVSDGCSGKINCGDCPNNGVCGGAGPNLCGASCDPLSCGEAGAECGDVSDGCNSIVNCGGCPAGQVCGAAGPNLCGPGQSCDPLTCAEASAECGLIGNGCGQTLDCGPCTVPGESCGGAGVPNQCDPGTGGCTATTCEAKGVQCGATSNGCGGLLDCGGCALDQACVKGKCEDLVILQ
ncbi:MAG: hypothetical protein QM778_09255 [Myxococcales bacterium]